MASGGNRVTCPGWLPKTSEIEAGRREDREVCHSIISRPKSNPGIKRVPLFEKGRQGLVWVPDIHAALTTETEALMTGWQIPAVGALG